MIQPLTERQKTMIVNNVVKACKNIDALSKAGYNFLYLASGFIAHYNQQGFIEYYRENSLKKDIIGNASMNQWRNFIPTDNNYDYYMSIKDVYNRIMEKIA